MAYGWLALPGAAAIPKYPITLADIEACGMDYVALGGHHSFGVYRSGTVTACYPGSPDMASLEEGDYGWVAEITLNPGAPAEISRRRVGENSYKVLRVDVTGRKTLAQIIREIAALGDPHLVLDAVLEGHREPDLIIEPEAFYRGLEGRFYHLRVKDVTRLKLEALGDLLARPIVGKFLRLMTEKIAGSSDAEERRLAEDALQMGLAAVRRRRL